MMLRAPLPPEEWAFHTAIKEHEIAACHAWEFARESRSVRAWLSRRKADQTFGRPYSELAATVDRDAYSLDCPEGAKFMLSMSLFGDGAGVLSHFPHTPWQKLDEASRLLVVPRVEWLRYPPMREAFRMAYPDEGRAFDPQLPSYDQPGNLFTPMQLVPIPTRPETTIAAVVLDWTCEDDELMADFKAWVRLHRPKALKPRKPGNVVRTLRAEVTALGIARLIEANGRQASKIALAGRPRWKEFISTRIDNENYARQEKKKACDAFRQMFPGEEPIFVRRKPSRGPYLRPVKASKESSPSFPL
jgi:hypothetical protein